MKQRLEYLLAEAGKRFDEAEVYFRSSESMALKVYKGETEEFSIASTGGVSLRVKSGTRSGSAYCESLEEEHLLELIGEAGESLALSEEEEFFFQGAEEYPLVARELPAPVNPEEYAEKLVGLERSFYSADERIENAYGTAFSQVRARRMLLSSHGFSLEDAGGYSSVYGSPIARDDVGMVSGVGFDVSIRAEDLDWEAVFEEALERTLSQLGAAPVRSGQYPLLFTNTAATSLLEGFAGNFIAESVQKGRSLLKGKLGETVASPLIELVDDPFHVSSLLPIAFDDEGVPVKAVPLIQKGVLVDYLYNQKSAAKDARVSNARGARGISTPVGTAAHHLLLKPGSESLEEMNEKMGEGILVTEITGFAGLDPVSGDFSVPIKGFLIQDRIRVRPVNEVLIAGNFFEMLQEVVAIGNTLRVGSGSLLSPALLLSPMQVSGK